MFFGEFTIVKIFNNMQKPFTDQEVSFLKYLNKKDIINKSTREGVAFVANLMKILKQSGSPTSLYYLFKDNYRPDGKYENVTWENFTDVRNYKTRKISNYQASEYVAKKRPFKGNNLSGEWVQRDVYLIYVVLSYERYPIYIFRDGVWFLNSDHYSKTTAKHIRASLPRNDDAKIIIIEPDFMWYVYRSEFSNDEIMKMRMDRFKRKVRYLVPRRLTNIGVSWRSNHKIKFKIKNVNLSDNDTIEIIVDVLGVYDGNNQVDYEETGLLTKKELEDKISDKIVANMEEYLPPQKIDKYLNRRQVPEDGYLKLTFEHQPIKSKPQDITKD